MPKLQPASRRSVIVLLIVLTVGALVLYKRSEIRGWLKLVPAVRQASGLKTVEEQLQQYGTAARARWKDLFDGKHLAYPPHQIALVAIKNTRQLEVYAINENGDSVMLRSYPILGASGTLGPKLREGDLQVPEGIYQLTLEPNTPYHLALRLNYPNATDLARAIQDGRSNPGSDILIHGSTGSIGCLAMGDEVSEDLFVLACDVENKDVKLVLCPVDFRVEKAPTIENPPTWLNNLYSELALTLSKFKK